MKRLVPSYWLLVFVTLAVISFVFASPGSREPGKDTTKEKARVVSELQREPAGTARATWCCDSCRNNTGGPRFTCTGCGSNLASCAKVLVSCASYTEQDGTVSCY